MVAKRSTRGTAAARSRPKSVPPRFGRGSGIPHPIDVHVGTQVRIGRQLLGLTQGALADRLGLTFQQVQKYETGANRVSASKLAAIAEIVQLPVSFFFSGYTVAPTPADEERRERLVRPETIDLIRFFDALPTSELRDAFLAMMRAIATAQPTSKG